MKSVKNKIICKTIEVRKDLERNYLQIMCVVNKMKSVQRNKMKSVRGCLHWIRCQPRTNLEESIRLTAGMAIHPNFNAIGTVVMRAIRDHIKHEISKK